MQRHEPEKHRTKRVIEPPHDAVGEADRAHWLVQSQDAVQFVQACLTRSGADSASSHDASRALVGASLRGTDSHGIRLLPHYCRALRGGRVVGSPQMSFERRGPASGILDAGHALGHPATYRAMAEACALAEASGIGFVGVRNSSHFGAAGSYAIAAAERGLIGLVLCNSDAFVLPHGGRAPFHGTNPIAFAAPMPSGGWFLLDMATSAVPWNRIQQYADSGLNLPSGAAVDAGGRETIEPSSAAALLPLGGLAFGQKGSGLAAMIDVLCAMLTGMPHSIRLLPMAGEDLSTPRRLSCAVLALRRDIFIEAEAFDRAMAAYLADFSAAEPVEGGEVLFPGEREARTACERARSGIPCTADLVANFQSLADLLDVEPPHFTRSDGGPRS